MRTRALLLLLTPITACGTTNPTVIVKPGDTIITVEIEGCCDDGDDCCDDDDDCCDDDCDTGTSTVPDTDTPTGCDDLPTAVLYDVGINEECVSEPEPVEIVFAPKVEWEWAPAHDDAFHPYNEVMMTPVVGNLNDDNGDGVIDENDEPDVVFTAYRHPDYSASFGALVMLDGKTGAETLYAEQVNLDTTKDHPASRSGVALGDIDADGTPEMCFTTVGNRLVCMTADTKITMTGDAPDSFKGTKFQEAYPSIGDMNGDGKAEVSVGPVVYNHDGTVRFVGADNIGGEIYSTASFMVDITGDNNLELVAGSSVYDHTGAELWPAGEDGYSGVADFDLDGSPEIVVVHKGAFSIYNASGGTLAYTDFSADCSGSGSCGGPPTIADFDGDGYPEIGIAGSAQYTVWDIDPASFATSQLWAKATIDASSGSTGAAVFDFEDDGFAEVVFADEEELHVWRGTDGADQLGLAGFDPTQHASGTGLENPVVAEVSDDGTTSIILASNLFVEAAGTASTDWYGVRRIVSGSGDDWAGSRPVWNQHAYSMTNIEDDLSVPSAQVDHWTANNTFRAAQNTSIESPPGTDQADLVTMEAFEWCFDCDLDTLLIWVGVGNQGLVASEPTNAAFVAGGVVLEEVDLPAIDAGGSVVVGPLELDTLGWTDPSAELRLMVDFDDVVDECDETNNTSPSMGIVLAAECE